MNLGENCTFKLKNGGQSELNSLKVMQNVKLHF